MTAASLLEPVPDKEMRVELMQSYAVERLNDAMRNRFSTTYVNRTENKDEGDDSRVAWWNSLVDEMHVVVGVAHVLD